MKKWIDFTFQNLKAGNLLAYYYDSYDKFNLFIASIKNSIHLPKGLMPDAQSAHLEFDWIKPINIFIFVHSFFSRQYRILDFFLADFWHILNQLKYFLSPRWSNAVFKSMTNRWNRVNEASDAVQFFIWFNETFSLSFFPISLVLMPQRISKFG